MGQKIQPHGFRLGIIEDHDATWFASKLEYGKLLEEDLIIRKYLKETLYKAGISKIRISRRANQVEVNLTSARPGLIIGKGGKDIAIVRDTLVKKIGRQVQLNVHEEKNVEACSQLVAENIASQLERRIAFRRAMKQSITKVLRAKAKGIKIMVAGRLGGSEIARTEWIRAGRVPLHTLRAKIDYGFTEAMTIYGKIGVKVWIYLGDVIEGKQVESAHKEISPESAIGG